VCGYIFHVHDRSPDQVAGELREVGAQRARQYYVSDHRKRELYMQWARESLERGYSPHFAVTKFRGIFKREPDAEWMLEASLVAHKPEPGQLRIAQ
jgi:hypothetical protein